MTSPSRPENLQLIALAQSHGRNGFSSFLIGYLQYIEGYHQDMGLIAREWLEREAPERLEAFDKYPEKRTFTY
jgi:hypothetical protein